MVFNPSIKSEEVFDLKDGLFSIVQNNLLTAYLSLKGMRGAVSCAILNRVISGVYFEVSKEKTEDGITVSSRSGTIWSEPSTIDDIVYDLYPFFDKESAYKSTRNNVQKVLNELLDERLFYRFGRNNFYAYTYEKNFVSWKYLFDGKSFVYPHTLKKMLNSESELWSLFLTGSKAGDDRSVFSLDEFYSHFSVFIDGIIGDLPELIAKKFVRLDKYGNCAKLFLRDCKAIAFDLNDYDGFVDDGSCKMSRLSASLAEKFLDIIPKDERPGYSPPRAKSTRGAAFRAKKNLEKLSEAYQIQDGALSITKDPTHLMVYFERRVKELLGIGHDFVIYKNVSGEILASKEIFDILTESNKTDSFLRDWIRWYIRNNDSKVMQTSGSLLNCLAKSFHAFCRSTVDGSKKPKSSIFEEIKSEFKQSVDIERICRKYGVYDTYNFIFVLEGESEATKHFEHFYEYIESLGQIEKRDLVIAIMRSTFNEKFPDFGYLMNKDHFVVRKLQELALHFANDLRLYPSQVMDREHFDFKERIKYEYTRRKATSTKSPG